MKLKKIKIRIKWEGDEAVDFIHFCYIPEEKAIAFERTCKKCKRSFNDFIDFWAKKDFGLVIKSYDDVQTLKKRIREMYRNIYPELYIESTTDRQGWVRAWCTNNMEKEDIKHAGKII